MTRKYIDWLDFYAAQDHAHLCGGDKFGPKGWYSLAQLKAAFEAGAGTVRPESRRTRSIADMIPEWFEGGTDAQMLDEALAQIRLLEPACEHLWTVASNSEPGRCQKCGVPFSEHSRPQHRIPEEK